MRIITRMIKSVNMASGTEVSELQPWGISMIAICPANY